MKKVLISGVSGFLGSHTAIAALNKGYQVVGTIRNIKRAPQIKTIISKHTDQLEHLTIVEADLLDAEKWQRVTEGVDGILHIASPFPRVLPKDDNELIKPAVEGALNVLKAAKENQIERVVLTSSIGSIAYGKTDLQQWRIFNENDWTDTTDLKDTTPYYRSKTLAEKAAWEFVESEAPNVELVTICPGAILGPVLESDFGTSANIVIKMLDGEMPALPKMGFEVVDVRDVAELHLLALESKSAAGQRYVATSSYQEFTDVAQVLSKAYPNKKVPSRKLPNFMVRLMSNFMLELKPILLELGKKRKISNQKAKDDLAWRPRSSEEAILSCAESVIEQNLV